MARVEWSAEESLESAAVLVRQAQAGDRLAFDRLVSHLRPVALRYAFRLLRRDSVRGDPREMAQEVVQSTFVEAWQNLPALRSPDAFPAWLRRILFKQWDRIHRVRATRETAFDSAAQDLPSAEIDPGTSVVLAEETALQASAIRAAIQTLPPGEQAAVVLFYLAGCSHRDVAAFLNLSIAAVKSRLHSARSRLRERTTNMSDVQVTEFLESDSALHKDSLQITEGEREELIAGVMNCYALFKQSYETLDWDETLSIVTGILTEDYELIFPAHHVETAWDKRRVEQDIHKGKANPKPRLLNTLEVRFEELLAGERDPSTDSIYQVTVRATFITENVYRRQIIPRIDTFVRSGTDWKMQRTLSLAEKYQ